MNYVKTNPVGLDSIVNYAMLRLDYLAVKWQTNLDIYPRCYQKVTDGYRRIEWFDESKGEYEALNVAEGNKFFFMLESDIQQVGNGYFTTTLQLFGILNLKSIHPETTHRADAEVWADTMNFVNQVPYFGQAERIVTGFDRVFGQYDYQQENDMQPYHCFRIDIPVKEFKLDMETCN
jgi:hypothetical protein